LKEENYFGRRLGGLYRPAMAGQVCLHWDFSKLGRITHLEGGAGLDYNIIHVHGAEAVEIGGQSQEVQSAGTEMVLPHGRGGVAVVRVPPQTQQLFVQLLEAGHHFVAGAVDENLPGRGGGHVRVLYQSRNTILEIPHSGHSCRRTASAVNWHQSLC
jgi:hypothetical protein